MWNCLCKRLVDCRCQGLPQLRSYLLQEKILSRVLLGFIIFFHAAVIITLWRQNPSGAFLRGKDWHGHLSMFSILMERLTYGAMYWHYNSGQSFLNNLVFLGSDWPPLFYYSACLVRVCFGWIAPHVILLTPAIFLAGLLYGTYKTGELLRPGSGVIAAGLTSFLPGVFLNTCAFNLEIAVCSMVMLIILLLLQGRWWSDYRSSFWLGIAVGLAVLIKYIVVLFIVVPAIGMMIRHWQRSTRAQIVAGLRNLGVAASVAIMLGLLYYGDSRVFRHIFSKADGSFIPLQGAADAYLSLPERLIYYATGFTQLLGIPGVLLCLSGIITVALSRGLPRTFLLLTILVPAGMIVAIPAIPQTEFLLPLCPLLALALAGAMQAQLEKQARLRWFVVAAMALSLWPGFDANNQYLRSQQNEYWLAVRKVVSQRLKPGQRIGVLPHRNVLDNMMWIEMFQNIWCNQPVCLTNFVLQPIDFLNEFDSFDRVLQVSDDLPQWPDMAVFQARLHEYAKFHEQYMFVYPLVISPDYQDVSISLSQVIIPAPWVRRMLDKGSQFKVQEACVLKQKPFEPVMGLRRLYVWERVGKKDAL